MSFIFRKIGSSIKSKVSQAKDDYLADRRRKKEIHRKAKRIAKEEYFRTLETKVTAKRLNQARARANQDAYGPSKLKRGANYIGTLCNNIVADVSAGSPADAFPFNMPRNTSPSRSRRHKRQPAYPSRRKHRHHNRNSRPHNPYPLI